MMYDENKTIMTPLTIGFVIAQLIVTVLIVAGFQAVLADDRVGLGVEVGGLQQQIQGLPDSSQKTIEYQIYQAVAKNTTSGNVQNSGVTIRDGSLINDYYEDINVHYVSFIADIANAGQSYRVVHEWSNDLKNKYVSPNAATGVICLDKSELIYGEFNCDASNDYLKNTMVYEMIYALGYISPRSGMHMVMLPEAYASSPDFKIKLYYRECVTMCMCMKATEAQKTAILAKFDELVGNLGFRSSEIPHYFDNCEDGM